MGHATPVLFHVHDPMCSWCWGYRPTWLKLRAALPADLPVVYVLGGLAPDNDQPMPLALRETIQSHWRTIEASLGIEFNFDFWTLNQPRRDTYKACRAVVVSRKADLEEAMTEAIQRAYYQRALNPSEPEVLVKLAVELGLAADTFRRDLLSPETEAGLQAQLTLRRALGVRSFPSLVLETGSARHLIEHDYQDHTTTLRTIRGRLGQIAE